MLEAGRALMLRQGFNATTIDAVCRRAGATKGAFFHYFQSKIAFGQAVLAYHGRCAGAAYAEAPFVALEDPLQRLLGYIDFTGQLCRDPVADGCLFGVVTLEQSTSTLELAGICRAAFEGWSVSLQAMLDAVEERYGRRAPGGTRSLADHFIATFEGAVLLARARGNVAPIRESLDHFKRYVASLYRDGGGPGEQAPGSNDKPTAPDGKEHLKMTKLHNTVTINAAPEAVWGLLGDLAGTPRWIPGIISAQVDGSSRVCVTAEGFEIRESILNYSSAARSFEYAQSQVPMPVKDSRGRFSVQADGTGSLVVWDAEFEFLDPSVAEQMTGMIDGYYKAALDSLRQAVESQR